MRRSRVKRVLSKIMVLTVAMTFTLMTTVGVDAAAKKKTIYQVVSSEFVVTTDEGDTTKESCKYTYNKKGLLVKKVEGTNKSVYKRHASGAVKSVKFYGSEGYHTLIKTKVNKKGYITRSKVYVVEKGKKSLSTTTTYKYKKGERVKSTTSEKDGGRHTTTYKNGIIAKTVGKGDGYKYVNIYNEKGLHVKSVHTSSSGEVYKVETSYKYNKRGDVIHEEEKTTVRNADGTTEKSTSTENVKYKYDKHGNALKVTTERVQVSEEGEKTKTTLVETLKYKKFKVAKKHVKYLGESV